MLKRLALALCVTLAAATADAGVLDRVKQSGTFTIGYRTDAMPFSFKTQLGEAAGYNVDLCKLVALEAKAALGLSRIDVRYVEVTAQDRFDKLARGEIDIECGASSVTLERRKTVDFSLLTFASGATLLYRADGPGSFEQLAGKKVGVHAGTTTEALLKDVIAKGGFKAMLVAVPSHEEGVERLAKGDLAAYFGDGGILLFRWLSSPARDKLKMSDRTFSYEPYALVVPRGDDDFRLLVDGVLARLYRSGDIGRVFEAAFGKAQPSAKVRTLFELNALPQ